jgi:type III pantothenate kinase
MSKLFIDIGNSRLKWRQANAEDAPVDGGFAYTPEHLFQQLNEPWNKFSSPPNIVAIASVASSVVNQMVAQWIADNWGLESQFLAVEPQYGRLTCGYTDPSQFGVDRWYALIGAMDRHQPPFCVCDLGSAITLDMVDAAGHHLGGCIAPGVRMMRKSLGEASALPIVDGDSQSQLTWGRDTHAGIHQGILMSALGVIQAAYHVLITHPDKTPLILTGGDAPLLLPLLRQQHYYHSDLVLHGVSVKIGNEASCAQ